MGRVRRKYLWQLFEEWINATFLRLSELYGADLTAVGMEVDLPTHGAADELMTVADPEQRNLPADEVWNPGFYRQAPRQIVSDHAFIVITSTSLQQRPLLVISSKSPYLAAVSGKVEPALIMNNFFMVLVI